MKKIVPKAQTYLKTDTTTTRS